MTPTRFRSQDLSFSSYLFLSFLLRGDAFKESGEEKSFPRARCGYRALNVATINRQESCGGRNPKVKGPYSARSGAEFVNQRSLFGNGSRQGLLHVYTTVDEPLSRSLWFSLLNELTSWQMVAARRIAQRILAAFQAETKQIRTEKWYVSSRKRSNYVRPIYARSLKQIKCDQEKFS